MVVGVFFEGFQKELEMLRLSLAYPKVMSAKQCLVVAKLIPKH